MCDGQVRAYLLSGTDRGDQAVLHCMSATRLRVRAASSRPQSHIGVPEAVIAGVGSSQELRSAEARLACGNAFLCFPIPRHFAVHAQPATAMKSTFSTKIPKAECNSTKKQRRTERSANHKEIMDRHQLTSKALSLNPALYFSSFWQIAVLLADLNRREFFDFHRR